MIASIAGTILHLVEPLGLVWLGLIVAAAYKFRRREKREAWVLAGGAFFMWLIGATFIPGLLLGSLERPYAGMDLDHLPEADAIMLLGGGSGPARFEAAGMHVNESGDRVLMALATARRGKAPLLIIGGGMIEDGDRVLLESETVRSWFLSETGITNRVIALPECGSTRDEAEQVGSISAEEEIGSLLLVTSASHMRRAAGVFRTRLPEITVHEVPCDFQTLVGRYGKLSVAVIPEPGGFAKVSAYVHEIVGWYYYRLLGWIDSRAAAQKTPSFRQ